MPFWQAFAEFMLADTGRIPEAYHGSAILIFSIGSALMGLVAVVLDWVLYSVKGRSVFDLSYGGGYITAIRLIVLWGVGAGIGGFLGSAAGILQITRAACIGVGVGWPLVLPRLIDSFTKEQPQQPADEQ